MERTLVKDLKEKDGEKVLLQGFAATVRDQKAVQFIVLRDQTGKVQLVHERKGNDQIGQDIAGLTLESAIEVEGTVALNDRVKMGGLEVKIEKLTVVSLAEPELPINIAGDPTTDGEMRLDWRYLDLRRPEHLLIFKVQTSVEEAMREYWKKNNYMEIHSPKLLSAPSESGAELFVVENYFGRKAYLAQSPQFFKQMAMAAGFDKIFEVGPVFRADPSATTRHTTEFTGVDMELSWVKSHDEIMDIQAEMLKYVLEKVKDTHGDAIKELFDIDIEVPTTPFPKITMSEAQKIVTKSGYKTNAETKGDLDPEGERIVAKYIKEKEGHDFVCVTDYPISVRPFYHMRHEDNPDLTMSYDMIYKGVEITTGAVREHRYEILKKQATEKGLKTESIQFYLNFFKYGCPPHGGLGLGLSRFLMQMLNQKSLRETTFLFRGMNRLDP